MQEAAALLAGLRWDREGEQRLRALGPDDWDALWQLVRAGEGQHLLARRLRLAGVAAPPPIAARLRRHAVIVARRSLAAQAALNDALRATGRPMLLLKGVDLAERLYGNAGVRPMCDVDFLVREADIAAFDAHLRARGYDPTPRPEEALVRSTRHHHALYRHPDPRHLPLELHWRLANDAWYRDIDVDGIWARSLAHRTLTGARIMAADDLVPYLGLHLKQHGFDTPLTQIWDLAEIVTSSALTPDWPTVWRRAEAWHLTLTLRLALHLVHRVLGVSTRHLSDWTPEAALEGQLPDVLTQLGRHPNADQVSGPRVPLLLSSHSSWGERLRAFRDAALPPRAEIRALYGRPGDGIWHDCLSYLRGWRHLLKLRGNAVRGSLTGTQAVRQHIDRVSALRRHLDAG